jgi:uncharacterized membrane protein
MILAKRPTAVEKKNKSFGKKEIWDEKKTTRCILSIFFVVLFVISIFEFIKF